MAFLWLGVRAAAVFKKHNRPNAWKTKEERMRKGFLSLCLALVSVISLQSGALGATKFKLLYTATPPFLAAYVAQDQGFFSKRGLEVEFELIPTASVIIPALVSNGAQVGGLTTSVLLQANEAGLDLIALAAAEKFPSPYKFGLIAREGTNIRTAADLVGKTIGVPSLNGIIDMMTRKFISQGGVKETQVRRIELGFPQLHDAMKAGQVDVIATIDPFFSRTVDTKVGFPLTSFSELVPAGTAAAIYLSTKKWATQNSEAVRAFQDALVEANAFIQSADNDANVRQSLAKYTKMPPQIVNVFAYPKAMDPRLTPESLQFWTDTSLDQQLITKKVNPADVIFSQ